MRVLKCFCRLVVSSHLKDRSIFKSIAFVNAKRIEICAQQESCRPVTIFKLLLVTPLQVDHKQSQHRAEGMKVTPDQTGYTRYTP